MLEDRYYNAKSPFDGRRSATVTLLIVNVACFLAQWVLYRFSAQDLDRFFALSLWGMQHGYVWQLLTYQFMHAGFLHLLFNCWAIYVFGRDVEDALGLKRFLVLYLASGVIGGMFQILMGVLLGGGFGGAVVGASAAAFGLAAAFAVLFPDRLLLLFFIIPLRAKYLLLLCGVLALLGILSPGDNIAHAAHLGGMVFGVFFIRYAMHWDLGWFKPGPARRAKPIMRVISGRRPTWNRGKPVTPDDLPPDEFLSKEVDPILDKISAHGIQSLTERERRILEAARERMARR